MLIKILGHSTEKFEKKIQNKVTSNLVGETFFIGVTCDDPSSNGLGMFIFLFVQTINFEQDKVA